MSKFPAYLPADYEGIKVTPKMAEFMQASFGPANLVVRPRRALKGDFNALAYELGRNRHLLKEETGYYTADIHQLRTVQNACLNDGAKTAIDSIARDMIDIELGARGDWSCLLRAITPAAYPKGVAVFHTDAPNPARNEDSIKMGRIVCSYNQSATRFLRNDRAKFIEDRFEPDGAPPFAPALFDMARIALDLGEKSPGAIHAGSVPKEGEPWRVTLVANMYRIPRAYQK